MAAQARSAGCRGARRRRGKGAPLNLVVVLAGVAAIGASGFLTLIGRRAARLATPVLVAGALAGLVAAGAALLGGAAPVVSTWSWRWVVFPLSFRLDGLAALFLVPIFVVAVAAAVFGESYWPLGGGVPGPRRTRLFFGLAVAGLALVVLAASGVAFLVAWELMAIAAFFLVATDGDDPQVRAAGWIYLAATHLGTLGLFALFALLHRATGSFALAPLPAGLAGTATGTAIFLAALWGFGIKAGAVPFHVWLPPAHAAAPSHVSALMSGVLIKLGIYGLFRILLLFPDPPLAWGLTLLGMGALSAVLGVLFALGQHDLKRLLAYHSVENIGIILLGLGLALLGRSTGRPLWTLFGLAGAGLHVVNHALFKSLLFLGAGAVAHATGTRELDRLGGLARRMPAVAAAFLIGAAAICGLPPLNGFVSEWFLYLASLDALGAQPGIGSPGEVALAVTALAPLLALVGALALACFAKAAGAVFLGAPRSAAARAAHAPDRWMTAPMLGLAAACLAIGLAPGAAGRAVGRALAEWTPAAAPRLAQAASLDALGAGVVVLAGLLATAGGALAWRTRAARRAPTWDCGFAAPDARMQYTASSFAATLLGYFRGVLGLDEERPKIAGLQPAPAKYRSELPDPVLDRFVLPALRRAAFLTLYARYLQQGRLQVYLLYVGATLVVLLLFA